MSEPKTNCALNTNLAVNKSKSISNRGKISNDKMKLKSPIKSVNSKKSYFSTSQTGSQDFNEQGCLQKTKNLTLKFNLGQCSNKKKF